MTSIISIHSFRAGYDKERLDYLIIMINIYIIAIKISSRWEEIL